MSTIPLLAISGIALTGFFIAYHIGATKIKGKALVCPINSDCTKVVTSTHSKIFGIPLEYFGMTYYLTIAITYIIFAIWENTYSHTAGIVVIILAFSSFIFSIYLTCIQAFIIKEWCMWCLVSALASISIFILSLIVSPYGITDIIESITKLYA